MKFIPAFALVVLTLQDKGKALGDLELKVADGWTVQDAGQGWTQLIPPGVAGVAEACAAVRSGFPMEGAWWASHKKLWNELRDGFGMKDVDPVLQFPDGPGDFIVSSGRWVHGGGSAVNVRLYSARADRTLVGVLWTGQNLGTWRLRTWPLERMLQGAVVSGAPPRTPPKVAEAYQCVRLHQTHYPDGSSSTKVRNDRIVLFEGGLADFSLMHDQGYDAFPLWKVDTDVADAAFGRWKASGDDVQITRGGKTEVYRREEHNLRVGGEIWKPMLKVDGLRLAGRFARKSGAGDPIQFNEWIEFSADGRFSMEGILWSPIVEGNPQKVPAKGSGTYEIRNWTLHLKLDGFAQSQDFLILEGDVKNPDSIWLRTMMYKRER